MFGEMTQCHRRDYDPYCCSMCVIEQKVEREEVAKVTGTNKDDTVGTSTEEA